MLEASDVERRRIAGDLHDGVVQDLTGVTYTLAGAARARSTPEPTAVLLDRRRRIGPVQRAWTCGR